MHRLVQKVLHVSVKIVMHSLVNFDVKFERVKKRKDVDTPGVDPA